ncbi:hypothetical protein, partial [Coprococcus sp. ART55/1]|uniref:hypothetical protein n=1 Tax=Coprococcus sp. ART55/1 TaxID=751585 RepID=UPI001FB08528
VRCAYNSERREDRDHILCNTIDRNCEHGGGIGLQRLEDSEQAYRSWYDTGIPDVGSCQRTV